mmetsp:Transcript_108903/g.188486  ORF Transcript_108903/g.188486 Transcript_108903/m.188486 type:complete len:249 (-) Transcript_108903:60-806(-)
MLTEGFLQSEKDRHTTMDFILGVLSVWSLSTAVLSLLTPACQLMGLGAGGLTFRSVLLLLVTCGCTASCGTWYDRSKETMISAVLYRADKVFGIVGVSSCVVFSFCYGGSPVATVLMFVLAALCYRWSYVHRYNGGSSPWPHVSFRTAALWTIIVGANAGILFTEAWQWMLACAFSALATVMQTFMEIWLAQRAPGLVITPTRYALGIARCGAIVLATTLLSLMLTVSLDNLSWNPALSLAAVNSGCS